MANEMKAILINTIKERTAKLSEVVDNDPRAEKVLAAIDDFSDDDICTMHKDYTAHVIAAALGIVIDRGSNGFTPLSVIVSGLDTLLVKSMSGRCWKANADIVEIEGDVRPATEEETDAFLINLLENQGLLADLVRRVMNL